MREKQLKILLADDDMDDCIFFKEALDELHLSEQFTAVHDGEQLMQVLNQSKSDLPDMLFLDINMPRKNGIECLSEIKWNEELKHLPVIMFSTSFEQEVVNQLYQNGAQYFIRKPSEFSLFKKIIKQTLSLITMENTSQPVREDFVLSVQSG